MRGRQEEVGFVAPSAFDMPLSDSVLGGENGGVWEMKVARAAKSGKEARGGWRALRGRKGKWRKGNMPDSRAQRAEGKLLAMTAFAGVRFLCSVLCWRRSAPPIRDRGVRSTAATLEVGNATPDSNVFEIQKS